MATRPRFLSLVAKCRVSLFEESLMSRREKYGVAVTSVRNAEKTRDDE